MRRRAMSSKIMETEDSPVAVDNIVEEVPVEEVPIGNESAEAEEEHTWMEELEVAGSQLVERVKALIEEGKVRRLVIHARDDKIRLEIPLNTGVAVGSVVTIMAPVLAALGALAALIARFRVEVIRVKEEEETEE
jgi:hypothetical protein